MPQDHVRKTNHPTKWVCFGTFTEYYLSDSDVEPTRNVHPNHLDMEKLYIIFTFIIPFSHIDYKSRLEKLMFTSINVHFRCEKTLIFMNNVSFECKTCACDHGEVKEWSEIIYTSKVCH